MANKYKWNICPRCHLAYIPWKEKQTYCSFWCELLAEDKIRGAEKMKPQKLLMAYLAKLFASAKEN